MRVKCKLGQESQKGFSLVTTLFIIVVLAVLGSYMVSMIITQNQSSALSAQGLRAWYAGVSGFEWVSYEVKENNSCPTEPVSMLIEGFTVTLENCIGPDINPIFPNNADYEISEAGKPSYKVFDITILAKRGSYGDVNFVSRTIRATIGGL